MTDKPFASELQATAKALRNVRARLVQLIADGRWPVGMFADLSTVQVSGLDVAEALERLAEVAPPKTPSPYDPDQRR